ncbi:flagellar protein [Caldanaerobacter subterraneus]|uniref:Flagellar protein n=1 Tax=Caldanaerobacter subterraneus TaxID=911092 RepID=A0A7Y2L6G2_9THEO|nr:TIGR02530 family flagellar biosynthesis protein [Caldanaerobacter subterraneus]NNG66659.1 flagellar protein [Caldanaerobacter subterraneus]
MKVYFNSLNGPSIQKPQPSYGEGFKQVFEEKLAEIKFSKHSLLRMEARNVKITPDEYKKLLEAVEKASSKGIKDSLIIMDNKAFVVNLKSRTVITAMDESMLKNSVFTNIDGAVII